MNMRPFHVSVPEQALTDLKQRIQRTMWPDAIIGSGWEFGPEPTYMRELLDYWIQKFDWKKIEDELNAYPNFIAEIDGYNLHFLHIKARGENSVPLIITHGWPGSVLEMLKIIPLLITGNSMSFDLVIPSMVGYGFSDKPTTPGCSVRRMGDLWAKLMKTLGYERYGAQGGDLGAGVSTAMALKHPDAVIGLHLNYIPGSYRPFLRPGEKLTPEEAMFEEEAAVWYAKEGAYAHVHQTRPLTVAYALSDSPAGLCAWIIEKFQRWSDCEGDLERVFTKDELLANVTWYWLTHSIHSSIRLYYENSQVPFRFTPDDFVRVPVGIARFPYELPLPPRAYISRGFNVVHWTNMPRGGHFAAMEQPELLANDIRNFFKSINAERS